MIPLLKRVAVPGKGAMTIRTASTAWDGAAPFSSYAIPPLPGPGLWSRAEGKRGFRVALQEAEDRTQL